MQKSKEMQEWAEDRHRHHWHAKLERLFILPSGQEKLETHLQLKGEVRLEMGVGVGQPGEDVSSQRTAGPSWWKENGAWDSPLRCFIALKDRRGEKEEGAAVEAESGKLPKVLFLTITKSILSPLELVGSLLITASLTTSLCYIYHDRKMKQVKHIHKHIQSLPLVFAYYVLTIKGVSRNMKGWLLNEWRNIFIPLPYWLENRFWNFQNFLWHSGSKWRKRLLE